MGRPKVVKTFQVVTVIKDGDFEVTPDPAANLVNLTTPNGDLEISGGDIPKIISMLQQAKKSFKG